MSCIRQLFVIEGRDSFCIMFHWQGDKERSCKWLVRNGMDCFGYLSMDSTVDWSKMPGTKLYGTVLDRDLSTKDLDLL